ncbi:unnamed protein product [Bathycoccus prasinos]
MLRGTKAIRVIKLDQTDKLKFIATDYGEQHGAKKRNTPLKVDYDVELDKGVRADAKSKRRNIGRSWGS